MGLVGADATGSAYAAMQEYNVRLTEQLCDNLRVPAAMRQALLRAAREDTLQNVHDWPWYFLSQGGSAGDEHTLGNMGSSEVDAQQSKPGKKRTSSSVVKNKHTTTKLKAAPSSPIRKELQAGGQDADELYIWLVDCYRMRCHDDLQWRGGIYRGIYETARIETRVKNVLLTRPPPRDENATMGNYLLTLAFEKIHWPGTTTGKAGCGPTSLSVCKDFFLFLHLVKLRNLYPPEFSFTQLLRLALRLLPKRFQKEHAQSKYGMEDAINAKYPSLRRTAEKVYGCSVKQLPKRAQENAEERGDTGDAYKHFCHQYSLDFRYDEATVALWDRVEEFFEAAAVALSDTQLVSLGLANPEEDWVFVEADDEKPAGGVGAEAGQEMSAGVLTAAQQGDKSSSAARPSREGGASKSLAASPPDVEQVLLDSHTKSYSKEEFAHAVTALFEPVGGLPLWREFLDGLSLCEDNFGLSHVLALDEHVPTKSIVMIKGLTGNRIMPSTGKRPRDFNGALGTLSATTTVNGELRFEVLVNDGSLLKPGVKAENVELHNELQGDKMSLYARMHLRNCDTALLAADLDYSSSSDEEEEGTEQGPSAASADDEDDVLDSRRFSFCVSRMQPLP